MSVQKHPHHDDDTSLLDGDEEDKANDDDDDEDDDEVYLTGYTDRLSGRPGDSIQVYVSSAATRPRRHPNRNRNQRRDTKKTKKKKTHHHIKEEDDDDPMVTSATTTNNNTTNNTVNNDDDDNPSKKPPFYTVRLVQCISSDPNPNGPGIITKDIKDNKWFLPRQITSRYQPFYPGSYGQTLQSISIPTTSTTTSTTTTTFPDDIQVIELSIWFFPTHIPQQQQQQQQQLRKRKHKNNNHNHNYQYIMSWGPLGVRLCTNNNNNNERFIQVVLHHHNHHDEDNDHHHHHHHPQYQYFNTNSKNTTTDATTIEIILASTIIETETETTTPNIQSYSWYHCLVRINNNNNNSLSSVSSQPPQPPLVELIIRPNESNTHHYHHQRTTMTNNIDNIMFDPPSTTIIPFESLSIILPTITFHSLLTQVNDTPFCIATGGTWNGKLEGPQITIKNNKGGIISIVEWDFSTTDTDTTTGSSSSSSSAKSMSSWIIPPTTRSSSSSTSSSTMAGLPPPSIQLYNAPTRGIQGRLWNGTSMNWNHNNSNSNTTTHLHYGSIYFHDDDIYDLQWKSDFIWNIPMTIPSGIYLLELSTMDVKTKKVHLESLPIFICPSLVKLNETEETETMAIPPTIPIPIPSQMKMKKTKDIVIVIPTFTYVIYGNHARHDFNATSWKYRYDNISLPGAYPYNPSLYPKYGLSTYNFHTDGTSGIHHASHKRPLFNLRPGYQTFGGTSTTCSGLRHFPADMHLISWFHEKGIDYDIITDHELDTDGVIAISNYKTVITGSHPEYHTENSMNALYDYRDNCNGNIIYLGGNGFYWKIVRHPTDPSLLEIRRPEGGVRVWATEPGEYYNSFDGSYGGLWRRNGRPPQQLVGIGFSVQGTFNSGMPYRRRCYDSKFDWVFEGMKSDESESETKKKIEAENNEEEEEEEDDNNDNRTLSDTTTTNNNTKKKPFLFGGFGFSGNGAAGFELDRVDPYWEKLHGNSHGPRTITILAQSYCSENNKDKDNQVTDDETYILVPEEVLTQTTNVSGLPSNKDDAMRSDMVHLQTATPGRGGQVFAVGSITFCGSLPWNNYDNNISTLLGNVLRHFTK